MSIVLGLSGLLTARLLHSSEPDLLSFRPRFELIESSVGTAMVDETTRSHEVGGKTGHQGPHSELDEKDSDEK